MCGQYPKLTQNCQLAMAGGTYHLQNRRLIYFPGIITSNVWTCICDILTLTVVVNPYCAALRRTWLNKAAVPRNEIYDQDATVKDIWSIYTSSFTHAQQVGIHFLGGKHCVVWGQEFIEKKESRLKDKVIRLLTIRCSTVSLCLGISPCRWTFGS